MVLLIVMLLGLTLVLTALILKLIMAGIVLVVYALVILIQFVVTDHVMVMKPMKHVHRIVLNLVVTITLKCQIVPMMIAVQCLGLVMALKIVKIRLMAVI
jgi:hypothetical protein